MGILVECPKCKVRVSVKRKVCKCGNQVQNQTQRIIGLIITLTGNVLESVQVRSKQAAENRLREIQTAKAEGNHIKKNVL